MTAPPDAAAERPRLRGLAEALGIEPGHRSPIDGTWVAVSDATREALVGAMGHDGSSEASAAAALERVRGQQADARRDARRRGEGETADPGCRPLDEVLGDARVFGLVANLYTVRSRRDPGFGTFAELDALVTHAAREGAAFVGLNPLHALASAEGAACPYSPESRLYRSPLYLDVEAVPELEACAEARERLAREAPHRAARRAADRLDPAARHHALEPVLRALHERFRRAAGAAADARRRAFRDWAAREGAALDAFATFQALADRLADASAAGPGGNPVGRDWRRWPARYRDGRGDAVRAFRREAAAEVERHAWVQFELDRQLGAVAARARREGLAIGLQGDLALGSAAGGADTWTHPELFARGVHVGAPPDAFSPRGQDWGLPPLDPSAPPARRDAFWERLLDASMRHMGALRIDHVLGLRRLFWIPEGEPPERGAYVRQPEDALLAALARASRRHGALVVGEDLGNVPEGFSEAIQRRGLLSSRVLLFEREGEAGRFKPAGAYPRACLATANTHDLPPLAAWLEDADLALRHRAGHIPEGGLERARREREAEREALVARLVADGLLADGRPDLAALAAATTGFLCATPAALVGVALDDLSGEREPVNLPGVPPERHASWLRRMALPLDALFEAPLARAALAAVPDERRPAARRRRAGRPPG